MVLLIPSLDLPHDRHGSFLGAFGGLIRVPCGLRVDSNPHIQSAEPDDEEEDKHEHDDCHGFHFLGVLSRSWLDG